MIEEKIYKVKLTKTEQKVLDFIMVHKEEACYYTSVELAEAVQVSGATVIRVVNKLGFSRFSQFKKELQTEVMSQRENLSQTQTSPARLQDVKKMGEREILNACMAAQQQNLKDAFLKNGYDKYIWIADMILQADRVFLVGYRMAVGAVDFFGRLLKLSRGHVVCITEIGMMTEELYDLKESDCVVMICHPRYSENVLLTLELVRESDCHLVVMTDKITEPVTNGADYVLVAERRGSSYFNSYLGMIANVEMLMSIISSKSFTETESRLEMREKYLDRNRQY
ncbi:MAG: MurR/RpiR family transcriptional regulator [Lachnospiraceae bacterium]|jgi:DNA-binding MurR/RpiR family transcriptional regulator|nr:MurR/RpiR family transcriptional regulator [Lachnospiraceae bacterium]MCI8995168.1 MurR/RpiR family transcriptional regulator [Lachnospiraceae bacterium]MCI9132760.1 MurR/RpiR family transcriptional regulator [Lachnospiraceae bacterium]